MAHIVAFNESDAKVMRNLIQNAIQNIAENAYSKSEYEKNEIEIILNGLMELRDGIEINFAKTYQ